MPFNDPEATAAFLNAAYISSSKIFSIKKNEFLVRKSKNETCDERREREKKLIKERECKITT